MATLVSDPDLERKLRAAREESGADRYDEVWEGVYMMTPLANTEHQVLVSKLATVLGIVIDWTGLGRVFPGVNVSDREQGWEHNYRAPDIAVVLAGSSARDCGTHYFGGPDFLVEIVSPFDLSRDKLPFYSKIGVRELLVIDRHPWSLDLYQLCDGTLSLAGSSRVEGSETLASSVIPLSFRLSPGDPRPKIEVVHRDGVQRWIVVAEFSALARHPQEHFQPALDRFVGCGVRNAEVRVAAAEDVAGDDEQFVLDRRGRRTRLPVPQGALGNA